MGFTVLCLLDMGTQEKRKSFSLILMDRVA